MIEKEWENYDFKSYENWTLIFERMFQRFWILLKRIYSSFIDLFK